MSGTATTAAATRLRVAGAGIARPISAIAGGPAAEAQTASAIQQARARAPGYTSLPPDYVPTSPSPVFGPRSYASSYPTEHTIPTKQSLGRTPRHLVPQPRSPILAAPPPARACTTDAITITTTPLRRIHLDPRTTVVGRVQLAPLQLIIPCKSLSKVNPYRPRCRWTRTERWRIS